MNFIKYYIVNGVTVMECNVNAMEFVESIYNVQLDYFCRLETNKFIIIPKIGLPFFSSTIYSIGSLFGGLKGFISTKTSLAYKVLENEKKYVDVNGNILSVPLINPLADVNYFKYNPIIMQKGYLADYTYNLMFDSDWQLQSSVCSNKKVF